MAAANSFLDFVNNIGDYIPGGTSAIPSYLAALATRNQGTVDYNGVLPFYTRLGEQGANANAFADQNAQFFNQNYKPAAINFNARAQGVGGPADLNEAADRNAANFAHAFEARRVAQNQDMVGVNPNSGGAMARRGALEASYAPGIVNAMNTGRTQREQYGDTLRKEAIPFLNVQPNYGPGMTAAAITAQGLTGLTKAQNDLNRQRIADTTKTFKLPFDAADEQQRKATNTQGQSSIWEQIMKRFPGTSSTPTPFDSVSTPSYDLPTDSGNDWFPGLDF